MEIIIVNNYDEMSAEAANVFAQLLQAKHNAVLGLATGSTPEGLYARLVQMYEEKVIDFEAVTCFNLDEYAGLSPDHPQSYQYYMDYHLYSKVNVKKDKVHIPSCNTESIETACREYDRKIKEAGGIDLQILGLGVNGHIGFNEPADQLHLNTHLVNLAKETIEENSRFFSAKEDVPRQAITMGVGTIMSAERIVLLASGEKKAEAVRQMACGRLSTQHPASLLQLHQDALVIIDMDAASLLEEDAR